MIADGLRMGRMPVGVGRLLTFAVLFFALQSAYESLRGSGWDNLIINSLTVTPSAAIVDAIDPTIGAHAQGARIVARAERLAILPGCEGAEAYLMLVSGVLCARRGWRETLLGLGLGLLIVYVGNLGRIVSLFFAAVHDRALFGLLHAYLAPVALVGAAAMYFALWLGWSSRPQTQ